MFGKHKKKQTAYQRFQHDVHEILYGDSDSRLDKEVKGWRDAAARSAKARAEARKNKSVKPTTPPSEAEVLGKFEDVKRDIVDLRSVAKTNKKSAENYLHGAQRFYDGSETMYNNVVYYYIEPGEENGYQTIWSEGSSLRPRAIYKLENGQVSIVVDDDCPKIKGVVTKDHNTDTITVETDENDYKVIRKYEGEFLVSCEKKKTNPKRSEVVEFYPNTRQVKSYKITTDKDVTTYTYFYNEDAQSRDSQRDIEEDSLINVPSMPIEQKIMSVKIEKLDEENEIDRLRKSLQQSYLSDSSQEEEVELPDFSEYDPETSSLLQKTEYYSSKDSNIPDIKNIKGVRTKKEVDSIFKFDSSGRLICAYKGISTVPYAVDKYYVVTSENEGIYYTNISSHIGKPKCYEDGSIVPCDGLKIDKEYRFSMNSSDDLGSLDLDSDSRKPIMMQTTRSGIMEIDCRSLPLVLDEYTQDFYQDFDGIITRSYVYNREKATAEKARLEAEAAEKARLEAKAAEQAEEDRMNKILDRLEAEAAEKAREYRMNEILNMPVEDLASELGVPIREENEE